MTMRVRDGLAGPSAVRAVIGICVAAVFAGAAGKVSASGPAAGSGPGAGEGQASRHTISVTTEVGSRTSLDVSPDGKHVVFGVLGQIHRVPIAGGKSQPLVADGWAWSHSPRLSPDGRELAYISDRAGVMDVWVMDLETGKQRRITDLEHAPVEGGPHSAFVLQQVRNGASGTLAWLPGKPGGKRELALGTRSGYSELLAVDVETGVLRLFDPALKDGKRPEIGWPGWTPGGPAQTVKGVSAVSVSRDGRYVYFSSLIRTMGNMKNPWPVRYRLFRLDTQAGTRVALSAAEAPYDEFKPEVSRSGRWLVYGRYYGHGRSELRVRDLARDEDRKLVTLVGVDNPFRGNSDPDPYPGYAFMPDEASVVVWNEGRITRVSLEDGSQRVIPVLAPVEREVDLPLDGQMRIEDGPVRIRAQRFHSLSDDRATLVFSAAGYVWVRRLPNGQARRLTGSDALEDMPDVSPDGNRVVYVAYDRTPTSIDGPGRLMLADLSTGQSRVLRDDAASYFMPRWSPDGSRIAVVRQASQDNGGAAEYGWFAPAEGTFHVVRAASNFKARNFRGSHGQWIDWSADGRELYLQVHSKPQSEQNPDWAFAVEAWRPDGTAHRILATGGRDLLAIVPSPSLERAVLISWDQQAYVVDWQDDPATPLSMRTQGARRISEVGALRPRWETDDRFTYGFMDEIFAYDADRASVVQLASTPIELPRRRASGAYAIGNVRLITVAGASGVAPVIENGVIVVEGGRILSLGAESEVKLPAGARLIDGTGLTIMPGIVDTHYHDIYPDRGGAFWPVGDPLQQMSRAVAYGVTTVFEPGGAPVDDAGAAFQELIETGRLQGSRWFFDGASVLPVIRPLIGPESYPQVHAHVRQKVALGNGPCLKNNNILNRVLSRMYARAAREFGLCIVGHNDAATTFYGDVIDGIAVHHWGIETPVYDDLADFMVQAGMRWSPHLAYSAGSSHPQATMVRAKLNELRTWLRGAELEKMERFYRSSIDRYDGYAELTFEKTRALSEFQDAIKLMRRGAAVAISGDIPISADLRIEAQLFQDAGATPEEILRSMTRVTSEQLGLWGDLGSLEPGKVADMLVLTADPREDIRNSLLLKWTIINGVIYDSHTLERVPPESAPALR